MENFIYEDGKFNNALQAAHEDARRFSNMHAFEGRSIYLCSVQRGYQLVTEPTADADILAVARNGYMYDRA